MWRGVARRGVAAGFLPSLAWHRAAVPVAMARRSAAAVARRGVAAAFLPTLAWHRSAVAVAMARRGAGAVAWRDYCVSAFSGAAPYCGDCSDGAALRGGCGVA